MDSGKRPQCWEVTDTALHASCRVFDIYKERCRHTKNKREDDFYVMQCPDWAQVLALTPKNELILVRQYRFGSQTLSWEIPAGLMEPNETAIAGAQRELLEETGYAGTESRLIASCHPNPALQRNATHYVLIENCTWKQPVSWDPHEELEIATVPLNQAYSMTHTGAMTHALSVVGLFYLGQQEQQELRLRGRKLPP